ncbi:DHHC zinc finger domain containing protein, partial [Aphelenchoides avenae]
MIFRWDVCGILCAIITYVCMGYADYVVIEWLVMPTFVESLWGAVHVFAFNTILVLAAVSHLRAMLTDPGIVPVDSKNRFAPSHRQLAESTDEDDEDEDTMSDRSGFLRRPQFVGEDWTVCTRCQSFRPPRAHHCRICNRCIRKMDHH